jgi:DNA-binding SARP family transcriptional activator
VLWPKHLALLLYLALSPGRRRTRDHLLGLLWGEKPESQARHALNEALRSLRAALGAPRLVSVADALELSDEALEVDALRFNTLAESDPAAAAAILTGDFLEGFSVPGAHAFEEWVTTERDRYRTRGAAVLTALGEQALAACQFTPARDLAQRSLALQPYSEPAVRLLMRAAALSQDGASALAAYRRFADRLEREIGENPAPGLSGLAERIRRQSERAPQAAPPDPEPPLIGRADAHRATFEWLNRGLDAGPITLLFSGIPGMGRTRLMHECLRRATLEGALVAKAVPLLSDHDAPWSTLRTLTRTGLMQAPGLVAAAPDALSILAWLAPELAQRATPREPRDAGEVAHALVSILSAVAEERPIALAIDDAHLADGRTLGVLRAALAQLSGVPLIVLLTSLAAGEQQPVELLQLRAELGRSLKGAAMELSPFPPAEFERLVAAMAPWCSDPDERERLTQRLMFETAGNPFFTVTLLRRLERAPTIRRDLTAWPTHQADTHPLQVSMPALLNAAVANRVADLSDLARRVLCAACIGGQALDLGLVAAVAELPPEQVEAALPELERRHFLDFDGERYAFVAPVLAAVIRGQCLTRGERKVLRRRAAVALASRTDLESRALRAELLARVGPANEAWREAVAVAQAAHAAGSARTARRALAAAERVESARGQGDVALQDLKTLVRGA